MNTPPPTISVITACFNAGATIRDCIISVSNQICPVEHIVVDGGSQDETVAIAEKYSRPDARIVSEKDNGLYDAINKGVRIATGDVIGTLNGDDFYPHNKVLSVIRDVFRDPKVDACYGDLVYVRRNDISRVVRYWRSSPYHDDLMPIGWMPPHPTFFARRSVYENHGAYRLDMGTAADYEFLLRVLRVNHVHARYIPTLIIVMRTGGVSSASLQARWRANRMDRKAWLVNGLQPRPWTTIAKPIRKATQYIFKKIYSKPWLDDGYLEKKDLMNNHEKDSGGEAEKGVGFVNLSCSLRFRNSTTPSFYVVTVNYHQAHQIDSLIDSLRPLVNLRKLIIVDHSGSDRLKEFKADFPILVARQQNKGYGAGLNRGLRHIPDQEALVMLCNPDTAILNREKVTDALNYMIQNPTVGCLIPRLVTPEGRTQPAVRKFYELSTLLAVRTPWILKKWPEFLKEHYYSEEEQKGPYEVDWGSGSAMFVRNSLFPYPISFDERFFLYFEDVDLCAQMWSHGFSVVHYPELTICHDGARLSRRSTYYFAVHLASLLKFAHKYKGLCRRSRFPVI